MDAIVIAKARAGEAVTITISTDLIIMQVLPNEKFELPSNELFFRPKVINFGRKTGMSGRKTG